MPIKIDKDRTDAYIGTFHYNSDSDMNQLENLRKMVSNMNVMLKNSGFNYQFRLDIKGRLGENNPQSKNYSRRSYSNIKLADATRVDAYIRRRY